VETESTGMALIRPEMARGRAVALVCEVTPTRDDVAALAGEMAREDWTVRAIGVPATTAALVAAGLTGMPFADCGPPASSAVGRRRQIAALARAGVVGVWSGHGDAVADLLGDVTAVHEATPVGLSVDVDGPDERHLRGTADLVAAADELPGARGAVVVVDLRDSAQPRLPDLPTRELLRALLDAGVAPSTLARGVGRLPGMTRGDAYDLTLALKRERSDRDDPA
jgi:16S rRNA C1402 (ribose-2'-O) methylase RsmI